MRFPHKLRPFGAFISITLFMTGPAATLTILPDAASNLVLKDVTSVDKAVPSESVAIAYDKTTILNFPSTSGVDSTSTLSSSAPSMPEVQSTSRAALNSNVPPMPEVYSTPNDALSSTPEVPSTPKDTQSSLASQTFKVPPTPIAAELTTWQVQSESKATLSSSLPPTLSTNAAFSSLPGVPSTLQVQPESKPALNSVAEVSPTLQVQTESKDALSSRLPPTQATKASPNTSPEEHPMLQERLRSKAALSSVPEALPIPKLRSPLTEVHSHLKALSSLPIEMTLPLVPSDAAVSSSLPSVPSTANIALTSILEDQHNPLRANVTLTSESTPSTTSSSSPSTALSSSPSTPLETIKSLISNTASHLLRPASAYPLSASTPALFDEADPLTKLRVQRTTPRPFARQAAGGGYCQGDGRCVPLSYCRLLADLLDRSCLIGDRLQELTCGYGNREPLVCCPPGGFTSIYPTGPPPTQRPPPPPPPTSGPPPPPPPSPLPSKCGIPQVFNWRADYRGLGSQPWVARIGFKNVNTGATQFPCCGSIISSRVILTAAHCALAKTVGHKLASVRAGEFDAAQDPDCTAAFCAHKVQDVAVSHVVVHPAYERSTFVNDVALLVLRQPLNFTLTTQPICLDSANYSPYPNSGYVGSRAKLVGWGLAAGQTDVPEVQQQLDLPVVSVDQCARVYAEVVPITSQHLCVGGEPGRDACSGFGGAPLVMLDSSTHTRYYQIAMVSFGSKQCGSPGIPSVYTRIDKYFDWIRANMNY